MSSDGLQTPIPPNVFARLAAATRYAITGVTPDSWFGPQQPLAPQAPPEVKGRQWDYPFGVNLNYTPRSEGSISFSELRALADALPLLRSVIETRKDQIAGLNYSVRARDPSRSAGTAPRIEATLAFLARPDRRHSFGAWLRMWLEDMLVIDAACLYPRYTRGGDLYSLEIIDGATITPLIGEDGRSPEPPDVAYQQVLHGVPAADFSADELLYLPRNVRSHRIYGMSPVEQVALTVNIALRRENATLDYYRAGSVPDSFATLPKEWTVDQIRQFQDYFDALMSGNLARRRMVKFMPADFHLTETRQPPLKDQYDEWLARIICYAFSVPASAFVTQVNRATSQTLRMQATQEGLVPLKNWIKAALDTVVQVCMKQPDLEFVWVGDDAVDPLQQAQTLNILVGAGIKTRDEARAELGLGEGKRPGVAKYNETHDERGRFSTAQNSAHADSQSQSTSARDSIAVASADAAILTDSGTGGSVLSGGNEPRLDEAAYPGDYHDQILKDELGRYILTGARCVSEIRLTFADVTSRLDIMCASPAGALIGVEVKTGPNPYLSPEQQFVYSHAIVGAGVTSPDAKIADLGFTPNSPLPELPIFVVWVPVPGGLKRFLKPELEPLDKAAASRWNSDLSIGVFASS